MTFFSEGDDKAVTERTLEVIRDDHYDVIVVNQQDYDDSLHVLVFAPDHGAHIDPSSGKGDHGLDIPEDMELFHCYGIHTANLRDV